MTTMTLDNPICDATLTRDVGGWLTCRVAQPEIEADAIDLVTRSAEPRPGNMRFALEEGVVSLCGELRDADGTIDLEEARARLLSEADQCASRLSLEEAAYALADSPCEWTPVDDHPDQWQAVATGAGSRRHELVAQVIDGGVEVCSRLAAWDDGPCEMSRAALAHFLATAHGCVRFVRFGLCGQTLSVMSFAAADRLETELPDSVGAVVTACRLVSAEVRALAHATVARAYLEINGLESA